LETRATVLSGMTALTGVIRALACPAASWVKKGKAESCNFPTNSCKFPTKKILGAQKFNFASKFPNNVDILPEIVFLEENFRTRIFLFDRLQFKGEGQLP